MKKTFLCAFALITAVILLSGCGKEPYDETALETADTVLNMTTPAVNLPLNENSASKLLSAFPLDALGLEKEITEYTLRLSNTRLYETDAVLVEAMEGETVEGTYAIQGLNCYVFDVKSGEYLYLTTGGAVATVPQTGTTATVEE